MLSDLATAWARANCTDQRVESDVARHVSLCQAQGVNCSFTVGGGLTRLQRPYLVHCFAGELFVFEITPRQARHMKLGHDMLVCVAGSEHQQPPAAGPPLVRLESLHIEAAQSLAASDPITGRCRYRADEAPDCACALRLDYELAGRAIVTSWYYVDAPLLGEGPLEFSFSPLRSQGNPDETFSGAIAMFFRLCTVPDPHVRHGRRSISNICAALVDVA